MGRPVKRFAGLSSFLGARRVLLPVAGAVMVGAVILASGRLRPVPVHANPAKIWVINDNVASAMAGVSPASFDSALATSVGRAPYLSQFDAFQFASGAQVAPASAIPYAGNVFVVVQTDGSMTNVSLNGRGLTCTPACDGVTFTFPDVADHIVVFQVSGTGTHTTGDSVIVTAVQDAVSIDARTIKVVGQAHDIQLTVARTTIQGGLLSCAITDSSADPRRTPVFARYTDVNNTPLVGYSTNWSSTSPSNLLVGSGVATSMVPLGSSAAAAENVACGIAVGSADVQAANTISGAIQGFAQVTRTQTIIVTDGSVPPSPAVPHASSGGTTTTFEVTLSGGVVGSGLYQIDLFSSPSCGAVSGNTHLGTFPASTDAGGNIKLYAIAPAAVTPGWVVQATATDPGSVTSPMSGCQPVVARSCTDDTTCNGYTDAQKIALGKDPFIYCAIMRADVDGDGQVTIVDLAIVAQAFLAFVPPAPARYDQDRDGQITIVDLGTIAQEFLQFVDACP
jgi:hypothetical protein